MIPSDLATRLRAFVESQVQPLAAITPASDELPQFETGQRFSAQIQNPLPDGTFRALVAGRTLTLALPDTAKSGDVLELVVTGRNGETVAAGYADDTAAPAAAAQVKPSLSQAGRLISQLLTGRFAQEGPAPLKEGQPLLASAPASGTQLAVSLQQAVRQSGLFFESHQAQWLSGSLPLTALLAEPQGSLTRPQAAPPAAPSLPPSQTEAESQAQAARAGVTPLHDETLLGAKTSASPQRVEQQSAALAAAIERTIPPAERDSLRIPERLMPLVHQQLEALASHQITWQGQVWPGQQMQWTVFDPRDESAGRGGDDEAQPWTSTLRLTLPRLGGIAAHLLLTPSGLTLRLEVDDAASAARLNQEKEALADALAGAGIPLTAVSITRGDIHGRSAA